MRHFGRQGPLLHYVRAYPSRFRLAGSPRSHNRYTLRILSKDEAADRHRAGGASQRHDRDG